MYKRNIKKCVENKFSFSFVLVYRIKSVILHLNF